MTAGCLRLPAASLRCSTLSCVPPRQGVGGVPASAFASLPVSLTSLVVMANLTIKGKKAPKALHITPPALCQLTALQELTVQLQGSIQAVVLNSMCSLRRLVLRGLQLLPAAGGPGLGLRPFTKLTGLEHLELAVGFKGED